MSLIPTLKDICDASHRIRGKVIRPPLLYCRPLSDLTGCEIFLKPECFQTGGSFKYRGATNAISRYVKNRTWEKVVTASSGNHGIAVAMAAREAGIDCLVIVPHGASPVKIALIRGAGAEVREYGENYDDCEEKAREFGDRDHFFLHPFDIPDVIAGQGTVGLEIHEEIPYDLHAVLVPVGGGGLITGINLGMRYTRPDVEVIGVEPENCASFAAAYRAGKLVRIDPGPTCADGLHTRSIGPMAFDVLKDGPPPLQVCEEDIISATAYCHNELKMVVEPSGAVAVAAVLSKRYIPKGTTVLILSGSNLDRKWFESL